MITIYEASVFSRRVYGDMQQCPISVDEYVLDKKTLDSQWLHIQDVPNQPVASSSFYAELYLKCDRGIPRYPMIAVRGTDPLRHPDNIKVDSAVAAEFLLSVGAQHSIVNLMHRLAHDPVGKRLVWSSH